MASVLIFSFSELMRQGLAALLKNDPSITVLGTYGDYRELLDALDVQLPDVLIIDLYDLEYGGALITEALTARYPRLKLLVLSESTDLAIALSMYSTGVHSFLHKSHSASLLQDAIHNIDRRRIFLYTEARPRIYLKAITDQAADQCHKIAD